MEYIIRGGTFKKHVIHGNQIACYLHRIHGWGGSWRRVVSNLAHDPPGDGTQMSYEKTSSTVYVHMYRVTHSSQLDKWDRCRQLLTHGED